MRRKVSYQLSLMELEVSRFPDATIVYLVNNMRRDIAQGGPSVEATLHVDLERLSVVHDAGTLLFRLIEDELNIYIEPPNIGRAFKGKTEREYQGERRRNA